MSELVFVKLGGSVITDKTRPETARPKSIRRLAEEVARSLEARPELRLVLGHGSGSFGHVVAERHGTRRGVHSPADWRGFAQVAASAAQLNRLVNDSFLEAGVPAWSLQPSSSAQCENGRLMALATEPLENALMRGLVPLVYGDVSVDRALGGTIISTEQIFAFLARKLQPERIILVTAVDGVFEGDPFRHPAAHPIPEISNANWPAVRARLSASRNTRASLPGAADVTGGMLSKVESMVSLARELQGLSVHILSGVRAGGLEAALQHPTSVVGGTVILWRDRARGESGGR